MTCLIPFTESTSKADLSKGRRMHSPVGLALRTAVFALIAYQLGQLAVAASLLAIWHSMDGEIISLVLILPAIAAGGLAWYCVRETAAGLKSR